MPLSCLYNGSDFSGEAMKLTGMRPDIDSRNKRQYLIGAAIALALSAVIAVIILRFLWIFFVPAGIGVLWAGGY